MAFDTKEPTFRHKRFKDYKATREKTPDELIEQLPDIRAVTEHLGLTVLEVPGWEADDIIGTLAVQGAREGIEVYMVTGDKDFMQLVSDRIRIYNITRPDTDVTIQGPAEVMEKFGVEPDRVIEVMGLMGDTSDNIPGVPGVGEKTALKLIREFGSIQGLYENLEQVKSKALKEKLTKNQDLALLSRELATLDLNAPVDISPRDIAQETKHTAELKSLFLELEFTGLLARVTERKEAAPGTDRRYVLVDDRKIYEAFLEKLHKARFLVIDLETTSLNPHAADIVGISVSFKEGEAYYLPANLEKPVFGKKEKDLDRFLEDLKGVLADEGVEICGQNIKYDLMVLHRAGFTEVNRVSFDTMVAHYLLYPGAMRHNLDYLSLVYLNVKKIPTTDLIGKGKAQISMRDVPVARVSEYACEDADMTYRLKVKLEAELMDSGLRDLFDEVEMPLLRVLQHMELSGVRVDEKQLGIMSVDLEHRVEALSEEIYEHTGVRFNINSTQQLGKILFERLEIHTELGIKKIKKTKTGYSTDASVLAALSAHPLPRALLEYRQMQKLRSTYVDALPRLINPKTRRIHASFNQAVTATGRLSSSDPNLQNIPIRTELGRLIREAFIPRDEEHLLLSADYSQIELRILAHISEDTALIEAFQKGEDIHRGTAALIFGLAPNEVTPEHRAQAKTINFGIIYGMGAQRLSRETGLSFGEAQAFIDAYFETFFGVKDYIERTLEKARKNGYVSTLLGRKRRIEEIDSPNPRMRAMAENIATNTPIQGTAADLIKKAMIEIYHAMKADSLGAAMILQVHDELVFDVPKNEMEIMEKLVREKMEGALDLKVPILVDLGKGRNWLEAH